MDFSLYVLLFVLMMSHSMVCSQTPPALILPHEGNETVQLNISTLPDLETETWGYETLSVFVQQEVVTEEGQAVQGRYTIEGAYLVFAPYFPFERGMTYVVRTKHADTDSSYAYQSFQIGEKQTVEKAKVLSIYPSASELPENLLRFYLYFNTPMKKGQALKHIQLIDAAGNIDKHAFMEFKQELWSPDGKRLTILFDPGRIKRGVSTNMELGPALQEGKRYRLKISDSWQDVYGQELLVETTKEILVTEAYRQQMIAEEWEISTPEVGSYDTLSIHFDRIMDHALLGSMIQIEDEEESRIAGHWEILEQEQLMQFIPRHKWKKGSYRLVLDKRLEDTAGNNLDDLLDHKAKDENNINNAPYLIWRLKVSSATKLSYDWLTPMASS